jgi:hypothetical protein
MICEENDLVGVVRNLRNNERLRPASDAAYL